MSHKVTISQQTMDAIRAAAHGLFKQTATKNVDGTFTLSLEDDVFKSLNELALTGETPDDTIFRALSLFRKQVQ